MSSLVFRVVFEARCLPMTLAICRPHRRTPPQPIYPPDQPSIGLIKQTPSDSSSQDHRSSPGCEGSIHSWGRRMQLRPATLRRASVEEMDTWLVFRIHQRISSSSTRVPGLVYINMALLTYVLYLSYSWPLRSFAGFGLRTKQRAAHVALRSKQYL